jgi:F0F1-type ATP synthase assembly protein I
MAISEDKKELLRILGNISSMGISVVAAIAIGVFMGLKLDQWFGTAPWFFYIFLCFGIIAGFRNVYRVSSTEIHRDDADADK